MIDAEKVLKYIENFGINLRKRRNELKMSYDDVALRTGISKSILSRVENGQNAPSFETFLRLHLALGVTTDFFQILPTSSNIENASNILAFTQGSRFERKNFLGRPAVSAELENIEANIEYKLKVRRSSEENILVLFGECIIYFHGETDRTNLLAGEIFTIPQNRRSYELYSENGSRIIRVSTPLSEDNRGDKRYIRVLKSKKNTGEAKQNPQ